MNADYELIKNIERSIRCFDDYILEDTRILVSITAYIIVALLS